jgi:hypothetical protein
MLKDELEKKLNYIKGFKITIKRTRIKIEINNKLEDNYKFLIE